MTALRRAAFWALVLFVGSIPFENGVVIGSWGTLSKLLGFGAVALGVVALLSPGRISLRRPSFFLLAAALFVAWAVSSSLWSINPSYSLFRSVTFAQLLAMTWLIWEFARTRWHSAVLMQAFVVGGYFTLGIALATFVSQGGAGFRNVGSNFNPNGFAIVLALAVPMAWYLALYWRSRFLYWLNISFLPLMAVGVILSASRGGLITSLVALLAVPLTLKHLGPLRKLALLLVLLIGVIGVSVYLPRAYPELQQNFQRLGETTEQLSEGTLSNRRTIWSAGWEVFKERPLTGFGLDGFRYAVAPIYGSVIAPHNAFLSVLVSLGLIGATLFMFVFLAVGVPLILSGSPSRPVHLILFVTLVVGLLPTNGEVDKFSWFVLAILASEHPFTLTFGGPRSRYASWTRAPRMPQPEWIEHQKFEIGQRSCAK